jgi:hypothetical protein
VRFPSLWLDRRRTVAVKSDPSIAIMSWKYRANAALGFALAYPPSFSRKFKPLAVSGPDRPNLEL